MLKPRVFNAWRDHPVVFGGPGCRRSQRYSPHNAVHRRMAGAVCGVPINQPPQGQAPTPILCTSGGLPFTNVQVPIIGDGVNVNDVPLQEVFPYVAFAQSGRDHVHISPGSKTCAQGAGCPVD